MQPELDIQLKRFRIMLIISVIFSIIVTILLIIVLMAKGEELNIVGGGASVGAKPARDMIQRFSNEYGSRQGYLVSLKEIEKLIPHTGKDSGKVTHLHFSMGRALLPHSTSTYGNTIIISGAVNDSSDNAPLFRNIGYNGSNTMFLQHIFPIVNGSCWELDSLGNRVMTADNQYAEFPVREIYQ